MSSIAPPPPGHSVKKADPSTINNKVLCAYRAWYTCAGDGPPWWDNTTPSHSIWNKYFVPSPTPLPQITVLPDPTTIPPSEQYTYTPPSQSSRDPITLFSSRNPKTTERHFEWMSQYGIDGVFLLLPSLFLPGNGGSTADYSDALAYSVEVVMRIKDAAEKNGRTWALMYDLSTATSSSIESISRVIRIDFQRLSTHHILESPFYLREGGRPVIGFRGYDHLREPSAVTGLIAHIRSTTPDKVYIMCSTDTFQTDYTGPSPWSSANAIISFSFSPSSASSHEEAVEKVKRDTEALSRKGISYIPALYPGYSFIPNPNPSFGSTTPSSIPRHGGKTLFSQFHYLHPLHLPTRTIYIDSFADLTNGSAILPLIAKKSDLPRGYEGEVEFVSLDSDGVGDLPSDWYMRLTGYIGEILKGTKPLPIGEEGEFGRKELLYDWWSERPVYVRDCEVSGGVEASSSGVASGSGSGAGVAMASGSSASRSGNAVASGSAKTAPEPWNAMKDEEDGDDVPPPPYTLEADEEETPQPQIQPQVQTQPQPQPQPQPQAQFQSTPTPAASTVAVTPVASPPSEQPNQYQSAQYQPTLLSFSPSTTRPNQHYWRPITPSSHTEQQQQQQPYQDYSSPARPKPQPQENVQPSNAAHPSSPSEGLSQMESPYASYLGAYHSTQTPTNPNVLGGNTATTSNLPNVVRGAGYNQNPLASATATTTTNTYTPTPYGSSSSPGAPSSYSGSSGSGYPPNQPSSEPGMYAPTAYRAQPQSPPPSNPNTSGPGAGMYPLTQPQDYSRNFASANYGTYNQIPSQSPPSAYTGSAYPSSQPQSPPERYQSPPITNVARPGQGAYAPTQLHSSPPGSYPNTPTLPGAYDPTSPTSGIGAHAPTAYTHTPFLPERHQSPPLPNVARPGPGTYTPTQTHDTSNSSYSYAPISPNYNPSGPSSSYFPPSPRPGSASPYSSTPPNLSTPPITSQYLPPQHPSSPRPPSTRLPDAQYPSYPSQSNTGPGFSPSSQRLSPHSPSHATPPPPVHPSRIPPHQRPTYPTSSPPTSMNFLVNSFQQQAISDPAPGPYQQLQPAYQPPPGPPPGFPSAYAPPSSPGAGGWNPYPSPNSPYSSGPGPSTNYGVAGGGGPGAFAFPEPSQFANASFPSPSAGSYPSYGPSNSYFPQPPNTMPLGNPNNNYSYQPNTYQGQGGSGGSSVWGMVDSIAGEERRKQLEKLAQKGTKWLPKLG